MWRVAEKRLRTQSIFVEKYLSYILFYRLQINKKNKFTRSVHYDIIFIWIIILCPFYTTRYSAQQLPSGNTMIVMSMTYPYNIIHHNEAEKRRNWYLYVYNIMLSIIIIVIIILNLVIGRALLCLICHMHIIIYNLFKRVCR